MKVLKIAFSLVELMITLIILSCIISALTPVITKKLQSQGITIGSGGGDGNTNLEFGQDCSAFGSDCALCFSDRCAMCAKTCLESEYVDTSTCSCKSCDVYSNCKECTSKQCKKCNSGYYLNNLACEICPVGYFCDGEIKAQCQNGYYQDMQAQLTCKTCQLKDENCVECNKETGECITCSENYELIDRICTLKDPCRNIDCGDLAMCIALTLDKAICMTKYNIGDKTELPIASGITTVTAGSGTCTPSSSKYCCWRGTTSSGCDAINGGYSGCTRTVCDWRAANASCNVLTYGAKIWRLPTDDEINTIKKLINNISIRQGKNGLMLCDWTSGFSSASCLYKKACSGTEYNDCNPAYVWAINILENSPISFFLDEGKITGPSKDAANYAQSVRCVSDL